MPNLVQTLENNPAFVHGGPFANIAHGCNSVIATETALKLADYVVTEGRFRRRPGRRKVLRYQMPNSRSAPGCRGSGGDGQGAENARRHGQGASPAGRHRQIGGRLHQPRPTPRHARNDSAFPLAVAINRYDSDSAAEVAVITDYCRRLGVEAIECRHWSQGGAGTTDLAAHVADLADSGQAEFKMLYGDELSLWDKARRIAQTIYGAGDIIASKKVRDEFSRLQASGYGGYPICMAKTQYSFSTDPNLLGAPKGHSVAIREIRLAAGAGFVVLVCGAMMTMPGLPRRPAANDVRVDSSGLIQGLS